MLGDLITRILVMIFGYAYPAFECYRVVEKSKVEIHELRFWCQYWILVAILSVIERLGDVFISWLPMYGEIKLALFIYLWYPNTKGSDYVYDAILRPYVTKHEIDIDHKLLEWRARAWDLALFYWKNCTDLGQSAFFQVIHYVASQSSRFGQDQKENEQQQRNKQSSRGGANRSVSETEKSKLVQVEEAQNEFVHIEANAIDNITQKLSQAHHRFRRFRPLN